MHKKLNTNSDIGKIIWSRGHKEQGVITNVSYRYCAGCGRDAPCYIVEWSDGKRTKPCMSGVKQLSNGDFEIE